MSPRRGAAAVEFAILLPVLLLLLLIGLQAGWFFAAEVRVIQATREAAFRGALTPLAEDPAGLARARLLQAMEDAGFDPDTVSVTSTLSPTAYGQALTVDVTMPYSPLVSILPSPANLAATTTLLLEDR